ncbi:MAG: hypothetical protein MJ252_04810 [archaeon]|nr:hypothetical protein [archaeon]
MSDSDSNRGEKFNPNYNIDLNQSPKNYGQQKYPEYDNQYGNQNPENLIDEPNPQAILPDQEPGTSTLDETVSKTFSRDLKMIMEKVKISMAPFTLTEEGKNKLKEWDFWGPLIFCFLLGLILSFSKKSEQTGIVFILVFSIVWLGGLIVSLNSQFLGVKLSVYQCISILGYCMFAIVLAAFANLITGFLPFFFRLLFSLAGFVYSSYGKIIFI